MKKKKKKVETWIPMTRRWKFICNARSRTYNFYIYTVVIRKKKMIFIDCIIKRRDVSRLKRWSRWNSKISAIYPLYNIPIWKFPRSFDKHLVNYRDYIRTSTARAVFSHFFPTFLRNKSPNKSPPPSLPPEGGGSTRRIGNSVHIVGEVAAVAC